MSSILDVVKPDLSHYMEDGKFDVYSAFENYLCSIQLFIFPAIKMLEEENCDSCGSALDFFEALNEGAVSMEKELIKHRKAVKTGKAA